MNTNLKFIRFWRIFSLVIFAVVLFLCYFNLPPRIYAGFDESGTPSLSVTKSQFFYGFAIFSVVFNMLFVLLINLVNAMPVRAMKMLPQHAFWAQHPEGLRTVLNSWMYSFVAMINTYLIIFLISLLLFNIYEDSDINNYVWVPIVGALILLTWLFYLPYRLKQQRVATEDDEA